jgi:hypothetical protein
MTHDQFFIVMHTRPFRPYRLKTAGGREIAVTHPEAIAYGGKRTAVVVLPGDRWEIIDIDLVEWVEATNEPAPATENRAGEP